MRHPQQNKKQSYAFFLPATVSWPYHKELVMIHAGPTCFFKLIYFFLAPLIDAENIG